MPSSTHGSRGHRAAVVAIATALITALMFLAQGSGQGFARHAYAVSPSLDVHYVPTPHEVVRRMLEMAEVSADDYVIDLGSGDGRIVIAAVRERDARAALGIDLDPQRVAEARENAREAGVDDRVTFEQGDLFEKDFSDATVLTMYLLQSLNLRLRPIILERMAPGTRIVSHAFDMGDWEPDQADEVQGRRVHMWIVPARVDGRWQFSAADGRAFTVTLTQAYQKIAGNAVIDGVSRELTDASLHGDEIRFSIGFDRYVGTVAGDTIVPVQELDAAQDWHARRS